MFPDDFKQTIKANVEGVIENLLEEHPDIKQRLNIPLDLYSIDEEIEALPSFKGFVNDNRALIRDKYNRLIRPRLQIMEDAEFDTEAMILLHFIDDFFLYAIYRCVEAKDINSDFAEAWEFFQKEFFSEENIFEFQARLKNVYYHGGIGLDNIIPWDDVSLTGANSALDYRMLGWERKGGRHYEFMELFQPPWLIFRKKAIIKPTYHLLTAASEAEHQFNLFTFVVRNVSEGDAYFNDIRYFGLGHFSPHSVFGVSWSSITDNDIYEEFGEYTTVKHPWDWDISKVLAKANPSSYKDYVFADWHMRLNGKFKFPFDHEYSQTRKRYYFYERILNLTFVFNSLLPDLLDKKGYPSQSKNKSFREDYLPEVLGKFGGIDKNNAKDNIIKIYDIRNKIAHGKPNEALSKLASLGTEEDINNKIHFFNYIVSRIILISLANPTFKQEMETYYNSGNNQNLPSLVNPFS